MISRFKVGFRPESLKGNLWFFEIRFDFLEISPTFLTWDDGFEVWEIFPNSFSSQVRFEVTATNSDDKTKRMKSLVKFQSLTHKMKNMPMSSQCNVNFARLGRHRHVIDFVCKCCDHKSF